MYKPIAVKDPIKIQPRLRATWTYENPEHLATSSIYFEKDLASIRNTIMFPVEKPAVLNEFTRELHGSTLGAQDSTLLKLIDEKTLERIVDTYWGRIWQRFMTFGKISAGIISILMIVQVIKGIFGIILNGVALHRVYGFSIRLLRAIWNSLAHLLISLGTQMPEREPTRNKPAEPEALQLISRPTEGEQQNSKGNFLFRST